MCWSPFAPRKDVLCQSPFTRPTQQQQPAPQRTTNPNQPPGSHHPLANLYGGQEHGPWLPKTGCEIARLIRVDVSAPASTHPFAERKVALVAFRSAKGCVVSVPLHPPHTATTTGAATNNQPESTADQPPPISQSPRRPRARTIVAEDRLRDRPRHSRGHIRACRYASFRGAKGDQRQLHARPSPAPHSNNNRHRNEQPTRINLRAATTDQPIFTAAKSTDHGYRRPVARSPASFEWTYPRLPVHILSRSERLRWSPSLRERMCCVSPLHPPHTATTTGAATNNQPESTSKQPPQISQSPRRPRSRIMVTEDRLRDRPRHSRGHIRACRYTSFRGAKGDHVAVCRLRPLNRAVEGIRDSYCRAGRCSPTATPALRSTRDRPRSVPQESWPESAYTY